MRADPLAAEAGGSRDGGKKEGARRVKARLRFKPLHATRSPARDWLEAEGAGPRHNGGHAHSPLPVARGEKKKKRLCWSCGAPPIHFQSAQVLRGGGGEISPQEWEPSPTHPHTFASVQTSRLQSWARSLVSRNESIVLQNVLSFTALVARSPLAAGGAQA